MLVSELGSKFLLANITKQPGASLHYNKKTSRNRQVLSKTPPVSSGTLSLRFVLILRAIDVGGRPHGGTDSAAPAWQILKFN